MSELPFFGLILPSAGTGTRLGAPVPKPFIEVAGRTLLEVAVSRFQSTGRLAQVVIPTHPKYTDRVREILNAAFPGLDAVVVEGGAERQHSITNGLDKLREDIGMVCVHDAVRPFVTPAEILHCLKQASIHGAALLGVPAKDTIKRVAVDSADMQINQGNLVAHRITETPDRSTLWQAQTPQIFKADLLRKAYKLAAATEFLGTDDASLVENLGHPVYVVEGGRENFKITYPIDLRLAELLLQEEAAGLNREVGLNGEAG